MVQKDIPLPYIGKNIIVIHKSRNRLRRIRRRFQLIKAVHSVHFHQKRQIQRTVNFINIIISHGKLPFQDLQETFINLLLHLQTDHLAPLALLQLLLNLLQKILRLLLIQSKICIPHNPEGMGRHNIIIQKQLLHIPLNNLFQKNHSPLPVSICRKLHDPGKAGGNLNHGKLQPVFSVLFLYQSRNIQGFIPNQGEGTGRIHSHRRQYRIHIVMEKAIHKPSVFLCQFLVLRNNLKSLLL